MAAALARRLKPEPDGFFYLSAAALRLHPTRRKHRIYAGNVPAIELYP